MGEMVEHPEGSVGAGQPPVEPAPGRPDAGLDRDDAWLATFDRWAGFDRWSSNLFLLLALVAFVVLVTVVGTGGMADLPGQLVAATVAITVVLLVMLVATSFALDRHRAWGRPAARAILWIMVVTGLGGALIDLTQSKFTVPLAAVAALLVLNRWPGPTPPVGARDRRVAGLVAGLFLVSTVSVGASGWLASPQSPLIAGRSSLQLTITTDCPGAGIAASGPRAAVVATVRWHWTAHDIVPLAGDGIELALAWPGAGAWLESGAIQLPAGWSPVVGGPAIRLLEAAQPSTSQGSLPMLGLTGPRIRFGTDAGGTDTRDGVLVAPLIVNTNGSGADIPLVATYAHAGAWTVQAETSCTVIAGS